MSKTYLTRTDTSKHLTNLGLPISVATLQKYATVGGGPKYSIFGGRAVYKLADLEEWIELALGKPAATTSEREALH